MAQSWSSLGGTVKVTKDLLNKWWEAAHVGYDNADEHEQEITRASNRSWVF